MNQMFKFMDKVTKIMQKNAKLKVSNHIMKQELKNSVNKQDVLNCLIIADNHIFVKENKREQLQKILGV